MDSNIPGSNGVHTTDIFTVDIGQNITNIDAGAYQPATLGDWVWNDLNNDGVQDIGEPGVPNVTVKLFTQSGQLLETKITNSDGKYEFTGLRQRLYFIQFSLPDGFQFTQQYNANNGSTDSDVDATGTTPLISLAHGSTFLDVDAGIHLTTVKLIKGTVWDDSNEDGVRSDSEALLTNVIVHLKNMNNQTIESTQKTIDYGNSRNPPNLTYAGIIPRHFNRRGESGIFYYESLTRLRIDPRPAR